MPFMSFRLRQRASARPIRQACETLLAIPAFHPPMASQHGMSNARECSLPYSWQAFRDKGAMETPLFEPISVVTMRRMCSTEWLLLAEGMIYQCHSVVNRIKREERLLQLCSQSHLRSHKELARWEYCMHPEGCRRGDAT